jgi:hypothetical protein
VTSKNIFRETKVDKTLRKIEAVFSAVTGLANQQPKIEEQV